MADVSSRQIILKRVLDDLASLDDLACNMGVSELLFEKIEVCCRKSTFLGENYIFLRLAKKLNQTISGKPLNIEILIPLKN